MGRLSFAVGLTLMVALASSSAQAEGLRLVLKTPRELAGLGRSATDAALRATPSLDLLVEDTAEPSKRVTLSEEGLQLGVSSSGGPAFPAFALTAPAEGVMVDDVGSRTIQLDAQVRIQRHPSVMGDFYDVVLTAVPSATHPGEFDVLVQGWKHTGREPDSSAAPTFSARFLGTLE